MCTISSLFTIVIFKLEHKFTQQIAILPLSVIILHILGRGTASECKFFRNCVPCK